MEGRPGRMRSWGQLLALALIVLPTAGIYPALSAGAYALAWILLGLVGVGMALALIVS